MCNKASGNVFMNENDKGRSSGKDEESNSDGKNSGQFGSIRDNDAVDENIDLAEC